MNVAVFTLTRDRLEYTQHCFDTLKAKAGYPYDHYIVDNGSTDGTQDWLAHVGPHYRAMLFAKNKGISYGTEAVLKMIRQSGNPYDLIIKMDNDCEVVSENIIGQMVEIFTDILSRPYGLTWMLSPRVVGINRQPSRSHNVILGGREIGVTGIIGGLFNVAPAKVWYAHPLNMGLPLASGQDDWMAVWFRNLGGQMGYVEGLVVNHYETTNGQAQRFPEYFHRKFREEKELPDAASTTR